MGLVGKIGDVLTNVGDAASTFGHGLAEGAHAVEQHKQEVNTARRRVNLPQQTNIRDAFYKKLYNYADFDFLIEYLRSKGIAECTDIYTLNSIVDYTTELTRDALVQRSPGLAKRLFSVVLKLSVRKRKGLLAYVSLRSGKAKKISKWETFVEYAGFKDAHLAEDIWLDPMDLFPSLRGKSSVARKISKATGQASAERAVADSLIVDTSADGQATAIPGSNSTAISMEDITRNGTSMFSSSTVDTSQLLLLTYNQVIELSENVKFTALNSFDILLFLACMYAGYPNQADTVMDVLNTVNTFLVRYGAPQGLKALASTCNKEFLYSFREFWGLPDGDGSGNSVVLNAMNTILAGSVGIMTEDTNFREVYLSLVEEYYRSLESSLEGSDPVDPAAFFPLSRQDIYSHNNSSFATMYELVVSDSEYTPSDCCISDALMCLILHKRQGMSRLTVQQYATLVERLFYERGLNNEDFKVHLSSGRIKLLPFVIAETGISYSQGSDTVIYDMLVHSAEDVLGVSVPQESGVDEVSYLRKLYDAAVTKRQLTQNSGMTNVSSRDMFI